MPRFNGSAKRSVDTSLGVHIRALHDALQELLSVRLEKPRPGGTVVLRDHIAALQRAYPELLILNESDLAQALAEEDGDAVSEDP